MARTKKKPVDPAEASQPEPATAYFIPDDTGGGGDSDPYLGGEPAFYLYHRPRRYQLMAGRCVPLLSKLRRSGGIKNVGQNRIRCPDTGRWKWIPDMTLALAHLARDGCVVIPHDVDADAGHPSYLKAIPGTGRYCHRLCDLVRGLEPLARPPSVYADWLVSLMDRGILKKPHRSQVAKLLQSKTEQARHLAATGHTDKAQTLFDQLAVLQEASA